MRLEARAETRVPRPRELVFEVAVACETFPRILHPFGPLPGIAAATLVDTPALRTGCRRRITMTDGTVIDEELLAVEPPARHRYRWLNRPGPPFSFLVRDGEGDWTFISADGGTVIVWVYRFELTTPLAYPLAAPLVFLFRRWMASGLARLAADLAARPALG